MTRGGRRILVGCVLALVVLSSIGGLSGGVVATPEGSDDAEAAVCDGVDASGNVLVATLPGSSEPLVDQERFYANTTLDLWLCSPDGLVTPYGDSWSLEDGAGYDIVDETEEGVSVKLQDGYGQVAFSERVSKKQVAGGIVVTELSGYIVDPAFETEGQLYVDSDEAVEDYRTKENAFLDASNETSAAVTALNETTEALAATETNGLGDGETAASALERVNGSVAATSEEAASFRSFLFGVAKDSPTPGVAVDTMNGVEATEDARREEATGALEAYLGALDDRAATLRATIRTNLLVGAVLGVVLGVLAGGALPYVVAERTLERKRIDSTVDYDTRVLLLPVVGGIAVIAVTVVAVALTGGLSLFGVIL